MVKVRIGFGLRLGDGGDNSYPVSQGVFYPHLFNNNNNFAGLWIRGYEFDFG